VIDPHSPSLKLVGAVLSGRYRLLRLLGEGGMGAVFEAEGLRGEGKRAIKLLHPEFAKEDQILSRFLAEAQANQALNHPNIARIFESARAEDGTPYLVMELLQGQSLGDVMEQRKSVTPQEAVAWTHAVLQALGAAHSQRIVHRDLKPDNLYLVQEGGRQNVKVLDFGIAKLMDAAGGMGSKTRTGVLLGTPGYMSPEQIKNSKGVDPRSDLWSMAIIFYEMLSGRSPFVAENEFAKLTAVLTEQPVPIEQAAPHLSAWAGFFRRALGKEPNERFQSAAEMSQAMTSTAGSAAGPNTMAGRAPAYAAPTPPPSALPGSAIAAYQQAHPPTRQSAPPPGAATAGTVALSAADLAPPFSPPAAGAAITAAGPPMQGAGQAPGLQRAGSTHISGGAPSQVAPQPPSIQVVQPPPLPKGAPYWVVAIVGAICLGLGFVLGLVAGK